MAPPGRPAPLQSSSGTSFSSRMKPKPPIAKTFLIPKSQCIIASADDLLADIMSVFVRVQFARRRCYVCDESGRCIGMVGLGTIVRAWYGGKDRHQTKLKDVMRRDFAFCSESSRLDDCRNIMGRERVHYLVVTDNGRADGKMLGAMTSWLVAQEQAVLGMPYPHNQIARKYSTLYQKLDADALAVKPARAKL
eukprot:TRINITY_DN13637_c0_g1_i1.p1 TRINITY_DN13637_c0_g1~~TRINITY_DN13637_c0_g1_i1.p1  ORF type:complete len:193 (+),score=65.60 TRINITY_DN13637_c0_g1_i1:84-662(+)